MFYFFMFMRYILVSLILSLVINACYHWRDEVYALLSYFALKYFKYFIALNLLMVS